MFCGTVVAKIEELDQNEKGGIVSRFCSDCGAKLVDKKAHACNPLLYPRISPELATRIAAEIANDFIKNNCDVYSDVSDEQMIEAIAELIERYGNE